MFTIFVSIFCFIFLHFLTNICPGCSSRNVMRGKSMIKHIKFINHACMEMEQVHWTKLTDIIRHLRLGFYCIKFSNKFLIVRNKLSLVCHF